MYDFLSLYAGLRLGVYDKIFVYIEAGCDASEIIFENKRHDVNFYDTRDKNTIDDYAGLGAGINAKNVCIEGFV